MTSARLTVSPVNSKELTPLLISESRNSSSMPRNWLKTSTLRCSASSSLNISSAACNLADGALRSGKSSGRRVGEQQACRKRVMIFSTLPRRANSPVAASSACRSAMPAARTDSYRARCSSPNSTRSSVSISGGNSASTCSRVLRNMNGPIRRAKAVCRFWSPASIVLRKASSNALAAPSKPGSAKANSDHSSPR